MRRKQSIIGILLSILMIINIFPIIKVSAASFTPRYSLSYEDTQSKYWASGTYGVSNGFPRNWNSGYSGGNCTWYAFGRAWELLGTLPNLCTNNAGAWYSYNKNHGYYPYGSTPKLGAIACWDHYDNDTGHVAVVEEIGSDYIVCSESGWSYTNGYFSTKTRSLNDSTLGMGSSYRFLGYIYIIDPDPTPPSNPKFSVSSTRVPVGQSVTFNYSVDNASNMYIPIDVNGVRTHFIEVSGNSYTTSFSTPGKYFACLYATNAYGNCGTEYVYFEVYQGAPSNPRFAFYKKKVAAGQPILFEYSVDNADNMYIPIDVNGVREHFIEVSGDHYNGTFTKPGIYSACLYARNAFGDCGTAYMSFEVYDSRPTNCKVSANVISTKVNTPIKFTMTANYAERYSLNVYRDNINIKNYRYIEDGDNTDYSITFSEPGTYKVYAVAYNYYDLCESTPIYITIQSDTPTTSTTATRTSSRIEVQTSISNLSQSASCVAAIYDSSGKLLGQTANDVNGSTNSVTAYFTNYSNASYVKVFLWDSLKGMKPLTNGEKITL